MKGTIFDFQLIEIWKLCVPHIKLLYGFIRLRPQAVRTNFMEDLFFLSIMKLNVTEWTKSVWCFSCCVRWKKMRAYGFGSTWGWVNFNITVIFGWTILLNQVHVAILTDHSLGVSCGDGRGASAVLSGLFWTGGGDAAGLWVCGHIPPSSSLDGTCVALRVLTPTCHWGRRGAGGRPAPPASPQPRALCQRLPATSLLHGLNVVMGATGTWSPAATTRISSVERHPVTLVLGKLLWAGRRQHGGARIQTPAVLHWWVGPEKRKVEGSRRV